ncbi:MAG: MFS transporter [Trebonia sp.]
MPWHEPEQPSASRTFTPRHSAWAPWALTRCARRSPASTDSSLAISLASFAQITVALVSQPAGSTTTPPRSARRRVFAAGLALFAAASAACALAPNAGALIAARAVQGAGAAAIIPMALVLLNGAFPPARRGWAIGIYGSVTGLAAAGNYATPAAFSDGATAAFAAAAGIAAAGVVAAVILPKPTAPGNQVEVITPASLEAVPRPTSDVYLDMFLKTARSSCNNEHVPCYMSREE